VEIAPAFVCAIGINLHVRQRDVLHGLDSPLGLSGFDLCPDEDVFETFWSSECYHWFLRENTVKLCACFNNLSVLVNDVLYFGEIRVVGYYKRFYGLCLICILGVHVFVCCLLW